MRGRSLGPSTVQAHGIGIGRHLQPQIRTPAVNDLAHKRIKRPPRLRHQVLSGDTGHEHAPQTAIDVQVTPVSNVGPDAGKHRSGPSTLEPPTGREDIDYQLPIRGANGAHRRGARARPSGREPGTGDR
jgi:hypothetical protein